MAKAVRIEDAGRKIGGARKDLWRDRAMVVDDLDGLGPEEAAKLVSKDLVWPVDYPALIEAGMPVGAAALVKVLRDRMSAKPDTRLLEYGTREPRAPDLLRRDYVRMVGIARGMLESCRSEAEVAAAGRRIMAEAGWPEGRKPDAAARMLFWTVCKGNSSPFSVGLDERQRAAALVAEGFPSSVPAWRRGLTVRADGDGTFSAWKARKRVADGAPSAEAALEAARAALADKATGNAARDPERPHLDVLERTGLPDRQAGRPVREDGNRVGPEDFVEELGFAGVEFGNWVPQDERRRLVSMAWDAVHDLAEVLGLPPSALSVGGRLSVAFGSRGGGRFAAHYEPDTRATNMTRLSGAGSLAHEIGHALDHMAGEILRDAPGTGAVRSGSGWREWQHDRKAATAHLGEEASAAWDALMRRLRERPRTREEKVSHLTRTAAEGRERAAAQRRRLADYLAAVPEERRDRKFVRELDTWCDRAEQRAATAEAMALATAQGPEEGDFGTVQTGYMDQALRLANGNAKGYHVRPTEMFARAFECYVFDRLAEAGARCDYLVHGVEEGRFAGDDYKGDPYPLGTERAAINAAMARLLDAMAPHLEAQARPESHPAPAP